MLNHVSNRRTFFSFFSGLLGSLGFGASAAGAQLPEPYNGPQPDESWKQMFPEHIVELAIHQARACWYRSVSGYELDPHLTNAMARRFALWIDDCARAHGDNDFYRSLLDQCADKLGYLKDAARTADDGTVCDEPLRLKIPELVDKLRERADFGNSMMRAVGIDPLDPGQHMVGVIRHGDYSATIDRLKEPACISLDL